MKLTIEMDTKNPGFFSLKAGDRKVVCLRSVSFTGNSKTCSLLVECAKAPPTELIEREVDENGIFEIKNPELFTARLEVPSTGGDDQKGLGDAFIRFVDELGRNLK